jgi:hypothetical protein
METEKVDKVYFYAIFGELKDPITVTTGYCNKYEDIILLLDNPKYAPKGTRISYTVISEKSYGLADQMLDIYEKNKRMLPWVTYLFNVITAMVDDEEFEYDIDVAFENALRMLNTFVKYDKSTMLMGKEEYEDILKNAKVAIKKAEAKSPEYGALELLIEKHEKRLALLNSGNHNIIIV